VEAAQVSLLRWLRRQLRQPIPAREHLEAAVENDDVTEARRLLAGFEFSDEQRRNVKQLLDAWERQTTPRSAFGTMTPEPDSTSGGSAGSREDA